MKKDFVTLTVNKREYTFSVGTAFGQLPPSETLVDTLRNRLGLTGTKSSCNEGACGCCTVIKDTYAVASCMTLTVDCDGSDIITINIHLRLVICITRTSLSSDYTASV